MYICNTNTCCNVYSGEAFASQKFSCLEEVYCDIAQTMERKCLLKESYLVRVVPRLSAQEMTIWPAKGQQISPSLHSFHPFSQLSIGKEALHFSLHRLEMHKMVLHKDKYVERYRLMGNRKEQNISGRRDLQGNGGFTKTCVQELDALTSRKRKAQRPEEETFIWNKKNRNWDM